MRNKALSNMVERALGIIGLFLMLVTARLANRAYADQQMGMHRLSGFLARRTIDLIAAVGWLADRLPPPAHTQTQFVTR